MSYLTRLCRALCSRDQCLPWVGRDGCGRYCPDCPIHCPSSAPQVGSPKRGCCGGCSWIGEAWNCKDRQGGGWKGSELLPRQQPSASNKVTQELHSGGTFGINPAEGHAYIPASIPYIVPATPWPLGEEGLQRGLACKRLMLWHASPTTNRVQVLPPFDTAMQSG